MPIFQSACSFTFFIKSVCSICLLSVMSIPSYFCSLVLPPFRCWSCPCCSLLSVICHLSWKHFANSPSLLIPTLSSNTIHEFSLGGLFKLSIWRIYFLCSLNPLCLSIYAIELYLLIYITFSPLPWRQEPQYFNFQHLFQANMKS